MKVLLLGGGADMAAPLIPLLENEKKITKVTLADRDFVKVNGIAGNYSKFEAVALDATDHKSVVNIMKEHDVSLGYIGPFYIFEKKMAKAAIEAGTHYVSIADDYDAYLDVISLEEEALNKGVKILTGFGNSPGITQVLAKKGYLSMKTPERININWTGGSDEPVGPSNLMHFFHIFTGTTLQWMDGKEVRVKTGQGKKEVIFPPPVNRNPVYYTGHAESVSLPRNLPGLQEVTLHGGAKPSYIVKLIKVMTALKLTSSHQRRKVLANFFHRIEGIFSAGGIDKSVGRVDVFGYDERGRHCHRYYSYVGHIAEITSLPCFLAALWLGNGVWDNKPGGVYAPERIIDDPDVFLKQLQERGVEIYYHE